MTMTMYQASVPILERALTQLLGWLDKAEAHAAAKKFDPSVYLAARLAPDMLPFTKQIQIACDAAKFGVARIAGVEAPKFADDEATLDQLRERVRRTLDFVRSVGAERIDGSEAREVVVPRRDGSITMSAQAYLQRFMLPNFFFHVTTTYALLRHNGVDLGKADFLGKLVD